MSIGPFIVIGMHRSGTTLLAQLMRKLGVFMGAELNHHDESLFFLSLNEYLFHLAHASWDYPYPMRFLIRTLNRNHQLKSSLISFLVSKVTSAHSNQHWGKKPEPRTETPALEDLLGNIPGPWGWKDPRSSFTLPIWAEVFPMPKVIHIYRNGVDVSNSLLTRELNRDNKLKNAFFSCRCLDLTEAFALWKEYVHMCLTLTGSLPAEQVHTLCYESLLTDPISGVRDLAKFLSIPIPETKLSELAQEIRRARAFAFLENPQLSSFYEGCRNDSLMKMLGYSELQNNKNGSEPQDLRPMPEQSTGRYARETPDLK